MDRAPTPFLRKLLAWLLNPATHIHDREKIQRSRLLAAIQLALDGLGSVVVAIVLQHDLQDLHEPEVTGALALLANLRGLYPLNRAGYNRLAAAGLILPFVVIFITVAFSAPGKAIFLAFLFLPILLTSIFFPLRWTGVGTGILLLVVLALVSFRNQSAPDSPFWSLRNMWFFLLLATGLIMTFMWHLGTLEALRNHELIRINQELERRNAELERFTYTVSHELRSPIVIMKGFVGSIQADLRNGNSARVQADLGRVSAGADRMLDTLTDLLELSKIGRATNTFTEVELAALSAEVIQTLATRRDLSPLTIRVAEDLPRAWGDRLRLREILENLLENALLHAPGTTLLEVGFRREAEGVVYYVERIMDPELIPGSRPGSFSSLRNSMLPAWAPALVWPSASALSKPMVASCGWNPRERVRVPPFALQF